MKKKVMTLCIIHQHPKILLGMKKRGFGTGKWNGFGGKVGEGESIAEAARREVLEEVGLEIQRMEKHGVLEFIFETKPDEVLEVHLFRIEEFSGEPNESEEMKPQWFSVEEIPYDVMWPDDIHWLPLVLERKKVRGSFTFAPDGSVSSMDLTEVAHV